MRRIVYIGRRASQEYVCMHYSYPIYSWRCLLKNKVFGFIAFFMLILNLEEVVAVSEIPEDTLKYPVLVTLPNVASASGFFLSKARGPFYFVTAKHVLFQGGKLKCATASLLAYAKSPGYQNQVVLDLQLDLLYSSGNVKVHPSVDLVIVRIGSLSGERYGQLSLIAGVTIQQISEKHSELIAVDMEENVKKYDQVTIANDIFVFGYPSSLGIKNVPQIDFKRPLLRGGSVAGKNEDLKTIILDCPIYYGNSGGPVLQVVRHNPGWVEYHVIGVVTEFVPFCEELYNKQHGYTNISIENSGYSVAIPMDVVLELVNS